MENLDLSFAVELAENFTIISVVTVSLSVLHWRFELAITAILGEHLFLDVVDVVMAGQISRLCDAVDQQDRVRVVSGYELLPESQGVERPRYLEVWSVEGYVLPDIVVGLILVDTLVLGIAVKKENVSAIAYYCRGR